MWRNLWEGFKWFLQRIIELKSKSYPLSIWGSKVIIAALVYAGHLSISITAEFGEEAALTFSTTDLQLGTMIEIFITLAVIGIGASMIRHELSESARTTARVFIKGLPAMSNDFPHGLMTRTEERKAREAVTFDLVTESKETIKSALELFNDELNLNVFQRFVLHSKCEKILIGGLARVPFLIAYGSLFRTDNALPIYFDKFHGKGGKWQLLNDENENVGLSQSGESVMPNSEGDIGLAVAFSTPISKSSLPLDLQDHTLIIEANSKTERNLIKNQENLEAIASEIVQLIDRLSAEASGSVHLFLSVQSTLALELGRRFQEGTHKPWIIHNFDGPNGLYNWAVRLNKDGVEIYEPTNTGY